MVSVDRMLVALDSASKIASGLMEEVQTTIGWTSANANKKTFTTADGGGSLP